MEVNAGMGEGSRRGKGKKRGEGSNYIGLRRNNRRQANDNTNRFSRLC